MKAKYFNEWEFKRAYDLRETDPLKSKLLYEEYIQKYPKDYSAYPFYSSNLIALGELEEAEKILTFAKEKARNDKSFNQFSKTEIFEQNLFFDEIKLMCYQKKYQELYNLFKNIKIKVKHRDLNSVWFYSKKQLGLLSEDKRDANSYLFRQITKYDENDFFDHIKKHLAENNENLKEPNSNIFVPGFPIKEVIEEIKKYIPSKKGLLLGFYDNIYYFKYSGCGRDNNKLVNYIKVVCFDGTKDIITLCPVIGSDTLPHVDLNYMVKDCGDVKIKKISRIDKFKQRYNM